MIKSITLFFLLLSGVVTSQEDSLTRQRVPEWASKTLFESEIMEKYTLDDTRNPFYLEEDFTGDGVVDIAFFCQE